MAVSELKLSLSKQGYVQDHCAVVKKSHFICIRIKIIFKSIVSQLASL